MVVKVELIDNSDDQFKVSPGNPVKVEEKPVEEEIGEEIVNDVIPPGERYAPKQPVPLENRKGLDWFDGTSWGNK